MQEMQETQVQSLDQKDTLELEMATHSSILTWEIPWTEEPGGPSSTRVTQRGRKKSDMTKPLRVHSLFTSLLAAFLLFETLNFPRLPSLLAESSMAHPISLMAVLPR